MRVLIIEDEMGALDDLRSILAESAPDIRIAGYDGECHAKRRMAGKEPRPGSDFHGHPSVRRFGFRDIQADGRRGAVIFTTAYDRVRHPCLQGQRRGLSAQTARHRRGETRTGKIPAAQPAAGTPGYREIV